MLRERASGRAREGLAALLVLACGCHRPSDAPPASAPGRAASAVLTPKLEPSREALALSSAFESAAKAIRPSVVRIDVESVAAEMLGEDEPPPDAPDFLRKFLEVPETRDAKPPATLHGTGSGVIIDAGGDVLTNGHVVRGARKVTLELADQRKFPGRVVGTDPLTDVGVVRFEKEPPGLIAARLGDSDKLRIGEWAIAVGSPLGMDQTVTVGIISGVGATGGHFRFESGERVRKYIQTDAKINPGNSGGPLLNLEGEIVGINTLINVGPGGSYGFAIPIKQAWQVAGILIKDGHVRYPYIGVSVTSVSDVPNDAPERAGLRLPADGALVGDVTTDGPAAVAGLEAGDVITKIGGRSVKNAGDVIAAISDQRIGAAVVVDYAREGRPHAAEVKVREYPPPRVTSVDTRDGHVGLALQTVTEPIASSLGLDPKTTGAVITEVAPRSAAQKAGLGAGDVIRTIDGMPIGAADEAIAVLRGGHESHLLRITNATGTRDVTLSPD